MLEAPGVQIGILETARGGMLLRGMGVAHNDVSVVTNVSADHLGHAGHRHRRPARRGQGHRHPGHPPAGLGRAQRRGPTGLGDAGRHPGPAVGLHRRRRRAGRARGARRRWAGDHGARRPPHRAHPGGRSRPPGARRRPADGAVRAVAPQRAQRPGGGGRGAGPRHRPRGRRRGAAHLPPRRRAQPGPDEHLLPAGRRRRGHRRRRPRPQRGRPRGAARRRPGPRRPRRAGAPGARHGRRPHRRHPPGPRRDRRAAGRPRRRGPQGRTTCAGAPWTTSRRQLRLGLARAGVGDIASYPTELSGLQALVEAADDGDVVARDVPRRAGRDRRLAARPGATSDDADAIRRKVVAARGEHEARTRSPRCGRSRTPARGCRSPSVSTPPTPATPGSPTSWRGPTTAPATRRPRCRSTRRPWRPGCASRTGTARSCSSRRACATSAGSARRWPSSTTSRHERPDSLGVAAFRALVHLDAGGAAPRPRRPARRRRCDQQRTPTSSATAGP